jgi:hypothetical protein
LKIRSDSIRPRITVPHFPIPFIRSIIPIPERPTSA